MSRSIRHTPCIKLQAARYTSYWKRQANKKVRQSVVTNTTYKKLATMQTKDLAEKMWFDASNKRLLRK